MSMQYIRDTYGVPAKRGRLVKVYYRGGTVVCARGRITSASHYIHVNGVPFHPTENVVYLNDDGTVLLDTRTERGCAGCGGPLPYGGEVFCKIGCAMRTAELRKAQERAKRGKL